MGQPRSRFSTQTYKACFVTLQKAEVTKNYIAQISHKKFKGTRNAPAPLLKLQFLLQIKKEKKIKQQI